MFSWVTEIHQPWKNLTVSYIHSLHSFLNSTHILKAHFYIATDSTSKLFQKFYN